MKKLTAILTLCLFLAGCSFTVIPDTTELPKPTAVPTTEAPETTAAPTTEATEPTPETTAPTGYAPADLVGTWVRTGTEVEGDSNGGGNCTLTIEADENGTFLVTYTNKDFPDDSYSGKTMHVEEMPIYEGCGNDRWMGVVEHEPRPDYGYALTIVEDGTLLLQNSFSFDGMPMVSYEFFARQP